MSDKLPVNAFVPAASLVPHADGLSAYLRQIRKFPMLSAEEEYMLAKRWREHHDTAAAHKLVTSHLRLAAKIAMKYRGYNLPQAEIISEANVGLMQAVKRFDPDRGFRLVTYAMWWIKASVQEYVLQSSNLVKLGTTAAQKKLFFNLKKTKARIGAMEEGDLHPDHVAHIARDLNVAEDEVVRMNRRLFSNDLSLNAVIPAGDEGGGLTEWQDVLVDSSVDTEADYVAKDEAAKRHDLLMESLKILSARERDIFMQRKLQDKPTTLEELSRTHNVSRERIRQIEMAAFQRVQKHMQEMAGEKGVWDLDKGSPPLA